MLTTPFAALTVFSDIFAHRLHDIVSFFKIIFFCGKTVLPGEKPDLPIMHMVAIRYGIPGAFTTALSWMMN